MGSGIGNPGDPCPTLSQNHSHAVAVSSARMTAFGEYVDDGTASTLKQRDYKDATDLVTVLDYQGSSQMNILDNQSPTLQSRMGTGGNQVPMVCVRRLTPLECERLQGFPDGWTASQSDTQRYKQLGNAVAVPVARWIAERIVSCDE